MPGTKLAPKSDGDIELNVSSGGDRGSAAPLLSEGNGYAEKSKDAESPTGEQFDYESDLDDYLDEDLEASDHPDLRRHGFLYSLLGRGGSRRDKWRSAYMVGDNIRDHRIVILLRSITVKECFIAGLGVLLVTVFVLATKSFFVQDLSHPAINVLPFINPLIGTANGGHVFPGANMPYGMVKAVADCHDENAGGYSTSQPCSVTGFSHMHDSGTGGATSFGNFPLFPQLGCLNDDLTKCHYDAEARQVLEVNGSANARPGYFGIKLQNGIAAEMTATSHAALYKFSFPKNSSVGNAPREEPIVHSPVISVDIRDLYGSLNGGSVTVSPETGRMTGHGRFQPSFGPAVWRYAMSGHYEWYTLYLCADFEGAKLRKTGTWKINTPTEDVKSLNASGTGPHFGAFAQFEAVGEQTDIQARVGVSFISVEQACHNSETEIPAFDFNKVQKVAEEAWKQKFVNISVDATGVNNSMQTAFWTGIYRTLLSPQDYTGENPLWKSDEPYFDSFYCIWDSFRSTHPFLTIIDPEAQTLMVRALLDIYKHEGKLPDCRMSLCKGNTQGGSNADIVIADALVKKISKGIDWDLAYEAVLSDAEDEPEDWSKEGRGNLESWKNLGYIPVNDQDRLGEGLRTRSVSRSLEYAYDDYCIATMAKARGNTSDYEKYIQRSQNWRNVFNTDIALRPQGSDSEFRGFVQPKALDGSWQFEDPNLCNPITGFQRPCYFFEGGYSTYEGGSWLYSFFVPHDMSSLIGAMGGREAFVKRLTYFHDSGIVDISDEQSFLTVFQYHYAGRPALSSHRAHKFIPSVFNDKFDGIPGNDDSGSMGSFQAFCMMGFFPNPGQDVYMLIAPFFKEVRLTHPETGKTAIIKSTNWDPEYKNIYIQSAKLNGQVYAKSWITHSFFLEGGTLEFVVGPEESVWGTAEADLPPSLSTMKH